MSDKDILDIASRTKLQHADLHNLFLELGIDDADVENAERMADSRDFKLQANKVLKMWRTSNGRNATRRAVINALMECGLVEAKEILEEKWGLVTQGKFLGNDILFMILNVEIATVLMYLSQIMAKQQYIEN